MSTPVQEIRITGKCFVIIDLTRKFCRQYGFPYGKGLNIRYCHIDNSPDKIHVSVQIVGLPFQNDIQFCLEKVRETGWLVYKVEGVDLTVWLNLAKGMSTPDNFELPRTRFTVTREFDGYKFTKLGLRS